MKLNRREMTFVITGAVVLFVLAFYFLLLEPLTERRDRLQQVTSRLETDLIEMRRLAAQYKSVAADRKLFLRQIEARGQDFAPFPFVEKMARETGLTGRIESMTPVAVAATEENRQSMDEIDVRLSGIGLPELVRFLYRLESSEKIFFVVNLNIRPRYLKPDLLDVSLRLATPKAT